MGFSKGDSVKWEWGNGHGKGTIDETFTSEVTRTIDGKEITRKASQDEPAYLIKQDDGQEVLKSQSEIEKA